MKTWLIDSCMPNNLERLKSCLDEHGIKHIESKYLDVVQKHTSAKHILGDSIPIDNEVFVYGSVNLNQFTKNKLYYSSYFNTHQLKCSYYYPIFKQNMLNSDYIMLPYGDLLRRKNFIFDSIGTQDTVFIRPDTGAKSFTGAMVYKEHWGKFVEKQSPFVDKDLICLLSSPYNIVEEYRVFTNGVSLLSGCTYKSDGKLCEKSLPLDVQNFARLMIRCYNYQPDPIFVMDFCKLKNNSIHILECNSFSAAGFYSCDLNPIIEEWKKIQ